MDANGALAASYDPVLRALRVSSGATVPLTKAPTNVTAQSAIYTAAAGDFVLANAAGGAFAVTLPAVAAGIVVRVKKTDATANAVTVTPASGTIDGAATKAISVQYQSFDFVSDGTNWFVA